MIKNLINSDFAIKLLLVVSFLVKIFSYQDKSFGWDESTYLAIGKYFYSLGQVGFIEAFRPIVWPVILGFLWKLHLDVILIAMMLQLICSFGTMYLVYLLGRKVFNPTIGLLAAALFIFSPAYHYFNNTLLTDIPAAFLALWAIYAVFDRKYFLSGLIAMLAFLTKFTQALTVGFILIFLLIEAIKSKKLIPTVLFGAGCVVLFIPYLIFNYCLYGDFFKPLIDSKIGYGQCMTPWLEGIGQVVLALFTLESYVFIFVLPAIVYIVSKNFTWEALLLLALGIAHVSWVGKLPIEIIRFLISSFPYLYLMSALGIYAVYKFLSTRFQFLSRLLIVFVLGLFLQLFLRLITTPFAENRIDAFQKYAIIHQEELKGKRIWMSDPRHFVYIDLKISERMYSSFGLDRIRYLKAHLSEADYIFLDSTGLDCPQNSELCDVEKRKLIDEIQSKFKQEVFVPSQDGENIKAVFKNKRLE